ncbi:hypothetical protein PCC9214_02902 [Planktothrix tepida]|nr:hypothetical protein PCC9214_02902 [Planktothrix tepida]
MSFEEKQFNQNHFRCTMPGPDSSFEVSVTLGVSSPWEGLQIEIEVMSAS